MSSDRMTMRKPTAAFLRSAARITLALALTASANALGCGNEVDSTAGVVATWEIHPDPPDTGRATIVVSLQDSSGAPIRGADVVIEGIMTHPGMAPEIVEAHEMDAGRYTADMRFTMRGDWILLLEATLPDARTLSRKKELSGVGAR